MTHNMLFHEFIDSLVEYGEDVLAEEYASEVFLSLLFKGYEALEILDMPVETLCKELRRPEGVYGWNTVWGKKIVCG